MVTPLVARDKLDVAGLERLVEHIIAGGVHGLFILGTSGEAPSLSYALRRELIERTCNLVKGRLPVLVGITDTSCVESVNLAVHAAKAGAAAVVTSTPYYFPAGQRELAEYMERLVQELPLPLFLYNIPMMTRIAFEISTVKRLLQLEGIVGIKDSSGDLRYFGELVNLTRQRPDWTVLIGQEHLLAEALRCGGHGVVGGGANFYPALFVNLYQAVTRGNGQAELQKRVLQIDEVYRASNEASALIKGMKCALSLLGICDDFMAEPFSRFPEPERGRIRAVLVRAGLLS